MAEIAIVFHWPKAELEALSLDDLIAWRERAVSTWNRFHGSGEDRR